MYKLKHNSLHAEINPVGAELSSLQHNGQEFLWQGDKQFWTGRAPILFPIVGAIKDNQTRYNGKLYEMPRHGIARRRKFDCIDQTSDSHITMKLQADDETLACYPWQFELQVHFTLHDSGITIRYDIYNHDTESMLFTIGSHPAFALKLNESTGLSDYEILFTQEEALKRFALNDDGLLDPVAASYPTTDNKITLSEDIFNEDALVFRHIKSDCIELLCKQKTVLSVDTDGAPHLGIWSKPGAPFVCIEPWLGTSDFANSDGEFKNKEDLQTLAPNKMFSHQIGINFPQ